MKMHNDEEGNSAKSVTVVGLMLRIVGITIAILLVTALAIASVFFAASIWLLKHGTLVD